MNNALPSPARPAASPRKRRAIWLAMVSLSIACLSVIALPTETLAQAINFDLGQGPTTTARLVQIILLVTVLSLAPSILIMGTSFTRIVIVLSFLRSALGTQQSPPNVVLVSLALFLTLFVMQPTFDKAWENGIKPLMNNQIDEETSFTRATEPFRDFMIKHTRQKDLALFTEIGKANDKLANENKGAKPENKATPKSDKKDQESASAEEVPLRALVPAFMISELRRAFEIGFLLFLPFLIIDMVVASILMSMGMMMLPPSMISLPFKIIFFVLVDGWYLISGSLIQSYGSG